MSYYGAYIPDSYVFLKIQAHGQATAIVKLFAAWNGGYLNEDSWRLNSGCVSISEQDDGYVVSGYSGSEYILKKGSSPLYGYHKSVLDDMIQELRSYGHKAEIISVEEAMGAIKNG